MKINGGLTLFYTVKTSPLSPEAFPDINTRQQIKVQNRKKTENKSGHSWKKITMLA